jgi:hypothetical protein
MTGGMLKSKTRILEVDTLGNIVLDTINHQIDQRHIGGTGLMHTNDGGWVFGGSFSDTFYFGNQYNRLLVTKLDSNFVHKWTKIIGYRHNDANYIVDITIDSQGNYIAVGDYVIGHPDFPNPGYIQAAIATKITPDGEILWTNVVKNFHDGPLEGLRRMYTYNVNLLSSGNIILGGYLDRILNLEPQNEGWLAKISSTGMVLNETDSQCGVVSIQKTPPSPDISTAFPNPTSEYVTIHLPYPNMSVSFKELKVYNQLGKLMISNQIDRIQPGDLTLDVRSFPSGVYLYQATYGNNRRILGKFIVSK